MGKSKSKPAAAESSKPAATVAAAVKAEMVSTLPDLPNGEHVTSLQDFGYKVAGYADTGLGYGTWAAKNIPGFPDNVSDETKAEVFAGFIHRKADLMGADGKSRKYRKEGPDNYVPVPADDTSADTVNINVGYAMAYSSQQFGSLRKAQPNLHRLVKEVRDEVNKYCSNKWQYLIRLYREANKPARERSVNKSFAEYIDETLAAMTKRHKTALARGDTTAPTKTALAQACAAFKSALA